MRKPQLRVQEYPHSRTARYVIEGLRINGKRKRLFFRTRIEAQRELARIKIKRAREGEDALAIPDSLRIMARDCAALLSPHNKTIAEATAFYLAHLEALSSSITVAELAREYQKSRQRAGLSDVHLIDLKYRLGRFSRDFGEMPVQSLSGAQIENWLHGLALSPKSTNNFRSRLSALFIYAICRHYLSANPIDGITPIKDVAKPPEIFTPEELTAVLTHAEPEILPAIVIGAFAGLRTAELLRLDWREVDLSRGFVHVSALNAKSARRRLVPITDNLAEWLRPYAGHAGKMYGAPLGVYHKQCRALAAHAGLSHWPKNGLRHSFASFHLARWQDAARLSLVMGHQTAAMLFAHYRELVTPESAARYWAIRPAETKDNVVPLKLSL